MIYPKFLELGDRIGVTAPSAGAEDEIDLNRLDKAKSKLDNLGYKIIETNNCRTCVKGRSSSSMERAKQLDELYEDKKIKAIIGLAGGEFLLEMLSYVNEKTIKDNPKWLQGFSDMTGLLFPITTQLDISTIYGSNFKTFAMRNWHSSIKNNIEILKGNIITQESYDMYENQDRDKTTGDESYNLDSKVKWINLKNEESINIKGRIIGGCLDVILSLIGTKFDSINNFIEKYKNDGIVWYFDCCEISSEDLVRAMWQFKEAGYFKYLKGIVFGRNAIDKSYYNISFKDAVKESLLDLDIPIILDADIGHKPPRMTIINGAIADIYSSNGKGSIRFELK